MQPLKPANPDNDGRDPARSPVAPYYSLWTGPDGRSRLNRCELADFVSKSISDGAAPQWLRELPGEVSGLRLAVLPVGWVGEWHESPQPQWVVPLAGRWFLETQDGQRAEMGPGDSHFGQDQGTRKVDGTRGHRSGQLGDEPCVQLLVQFRESPARQAACPFE